TQQENLNLTEQKAARGTVTELDVAQAKTQLANFQAQTPALEQQESQTINQLSLLLGGQPNALRAELTTAVPMPPVPPRVPVGVPAELARRRPDIRQAEAQLHAATAEIGVSVANFYPRVTLSGSIGLQGLKLKDMVEWAALQYAIGPSITVPIFQGGRLMATLELRKTEQQEAAIVHHNTVLQAWHEVDNALTAYAKEQQRNEFLAQAAQSNREELELARLRYQGGVSDYLPVLTAQQSLLRSEQDFANSTGTVATNLVALYKALGGGWMPPPEKLDTASR
ncbi:MAG: efflux transporter outer membrane subunit, partial [Pseudomonadota bacterium]